MQNEETAISFLDLYQSSLPLITNTTDKRTHQIIRLLYDSFIGCLSFPREENVKIYNFKTRARSSFSMQILLPRSILNIHVLCFFLFRNILTNMAITPSEGVDSSVIRINSPAHPSFYSVHSHRFIICLLLLLATYFSQANTLGMSEFRTFYPFLKL